MFRPVIKENSHDCHMLLTDLTINLIIGMSMIKYIVFKNIVLKHFHQNWHTLGVKGTNSMHSLIQRLQTNTNITCL